MITTLESVIHVELGWTWRDHVGAAPIVDSNHHRCTVRLADGTAARQANAVWHVEDQTLAAGQSLTLDLDLLEQALFGDRITIPLATVKALLIVNKNASELGHLLVGGATDDPWYAPFGAPEHTVKVLAGSPLLLANTGSGWDVGLDHHALRIAAIDGSVTFDVAILGTLPELSTS
jgi:hypothetical protein